MCSMETSEPEFYYLLRDKDGELIGTHESYMNYPPGSAVGSMMIERTTKAHIETLKEFECVDKDGIAALIDESEIDGILF